MENEMTAIGKYINEKRELQKLVIEIFEKSDIDENKQDFQNLINFLNMHQFEGNKKELELFLRLILNISNYHHRQHNFFKRIEKILTISSQYYKPVFSNEEIFSIFQQSKPILLILLKSKIIQIDQIIFEKLLKMSENNNNEICHYLYPELCMMIKSGMIEDVNGEISKIKLKYDIEIFESNRQLFENELKLCSIIRDDLIDDFVQYVHKSNISLNSQIKRSIFETNPLLMNESPFLIEYAAFFGSINIFNYLLRNGAEIKPNLWLYAIHSNNTEVIQFLEDKNIKMDNRTFSEAIKCHHNNIVHYICNNYLNISNIIDLDDESLSSIYSSFNYEFFCDEIDENKIFFILCENEYDELVELYLSSKKKEIKDYVNQGNIKDIICKSLEENKLHIVYCLLKEFDCIPENFFKYKENITKIALPHNIHSINESSFYGCSSLTQIAIPSSVTIIENDAFDGCSSLKQVIIPSSVTKIGDHLFNKCSSLTYISIPSSVTSIGNNSFAVCSSLKQIIIPSSVTSIGNNIFAGCSSLKQIIIPSSVTSIGDCVFYNCSSLTEIIIPSSVTSIGKFVFTNCSSLKQVTGLLSITSIGNSEFMNCSSLENIEIPSSVTSIDINAFSGCLSLTQITFPSSLTKIGSNSFYNCMSLTQITFVSPSFVTSIGNHAFEDCSSLTQITIPSSVISIGNNAFNMCTSLTQITFASLSSVTSIGNHAFSECSSLTQVTIPSSVTKIGNYAFNMCTLLAQITFASLSSVTSIGDNAFSECSALTQITIPSSVTSIGEGAFEYCSSLTQVTFEYPSSVTSIGLLPFYECSSITHITIPPSLRKDDLGLSQSVEVDYEEQY